MMEEEDDSDEDAKISLFQQKLEGKLVA